MGIKVHEKNDNRLEKFKIDCTKCSGLCCTALFFSKIDGFPENKLAGKPCSKLQKNYLCKIHNDLEKKNMKGCIGYDCFGAGQHVTQTLYKGKTWQTEKSKSDEIFSVFTTIFQLYQVRYYLEEARIIILAKDLLHDIDKLIEENEALCNDSIENILNTDVEEFRKRANLILKEVSSSVLKSFSNRNNNGLKDFLGRSFKNRELSGADLSMKLLIATNFDGCIFNGANFLGADTRDTNFSNADLREAVFLTQGQINSAKGNKNTKLPKHLECPTTWK